MDAVTLQEIEGLSKQLYGEQSSNENARQRLQCFQNQVDCLPKALFILENSSCPEAMFMASSSTNDLVMHQWNGISADTSITARDTLFRVLWDKGAQMPDFLLATTVLLIARVTKLGWLEDERHMETPNLIQKFLESNQTHRILGLQTLSAIIGEMNRKYPRATIASHRKVAISFRDNSLKKTFTTALECMFQFGTSVPQSDVENKLKEETLRLALECLLFDFIGTTSDATGADLGTVQIPSSWKSLFEDASQPIIPMFFQMYASSRVDHAQIVMECLVQLTSTRKSLFTSESNRMHYLSHILEGILAVLQNKSNLGNEDCHHQFCRLLARLRANFQLNMLIKVDCYGQWIDAVCDFTVQTFQMWQWAPNSLYYLLGVWGSFVRGLPFMKSGTPAKIQEYVPKVVEAYVGCRLQSVNAALRDDCEDPLLDVDQIKLQLETIPAICRSAYEASGNGLISIIDKLTSELQQCLQYNNAAEIRRIDGQLAWIVYIIGAVTGGRTPPVVEADDQMDANLIARVFNLMKLHHERQRSFPNMEKTSQLMSFEISLMSFLEYFRRIYLADKAQTRSSVYQCLEQSVGLATNIAVLEVIVQKLISNLNWWSSTTEVVKPSLTLFSDLAAGYTSSKLLPKLDIVRQILGNHTYEKFAFLTYAQNLSCRTTYYTTLGRILLMNEYIENFDDFMVPFNQTFARLASISSPDQFRANDCRAVIVGLLRDLRGLAFACNQRYSYLRFFEWLFQEKFEILHRIGEVLFDFADVSSALLKFYIEIATNKNNRLNFDCSSPNGILLFKEASRILATFGDRLDKVNIGNEESQEFKFKGTCYCLTLLHRCLSGNYVNFSVFELYQDPVLSVALNSCFKISLTMPPDQLMAYPKLLKAFYEMLQVLFQYHIKHVIELEPQYFQTILNAITEGITSTTLNVFHECCSSLDHLASYCFKHRKADTQVAVRLNEQLKHCGNVFGRCLEILFQVLLFVDSANHWAIARPMLSLILVAPQQYHMLKEHIVNTQPGDRQPRLQEALTKLMSGIHNNLQAANREAFTRNVTLFRHDVKTYIVAV